VSPQSSGIIDASIRRPGIVWRPENGQPGSVDRLPGDIESMMAEKRMTNSVTAHESEAFADR
jgi:hypothetical protein